MFTDNFETMTIGALSGYTRSDTLVNRGDYSIVADGLELDPNSTAPLGLMKDGAVFSYNLNSFEIVYSNTVDGTITLGLSNSELEITPDTLTLTILGDSYPFAHTETAGTKLKAGLYGTIGSRTFQLRSATDTVIDSVAIDEAEAATMVTGLIELAFTVLPSNLTEVGLVYSLSVSGSTTTTPPPPTQGGSMTQPSETRVIESAAPAPARASRGAKFVFIGDFPDGATLNGQNAIKSIFSTSDLIKKYGYPRASTGILDIVKSHFEMASVGDIYAGRVIGTGGAPAQTALIEDSAVVGNARYRATWRYPSTAGNSYDFVVEAGQQSTASSRVDSKVYYKNRITGEVELESVVYGNANPASSDYFIAKFNAQGLPIILSDSFADTGYTVVDEPELGVYALAGGTNAAAPIAGDWTAAVTALQNTGLRRAVIVVDSTAPQAQVQSLMDIGASQRWMILQALADGTTPEANETYTELFTSNRHRLSVFKGAGQRSNATTRRLSLIGGVTSQAALSWLQTKGSVNLTGANEEITGWLYADGLSEDDKKKYAKARVNPIYMRDSSSVGSGVVIGDVLTLDKTNTYQQWGMVVAMDMVVQDIVDWIDFHVRLKNAYPFARKVNGQISPISQDSLNRIAGQISDLFDKYPNTLLAGGKGIGWDWDGDTVEEAGETMPFFRLGLLFAGVARRIIIEIGRVEGRFSSAQKTVGGGQ
jgi:hypothetical protein